MGHRRARTRRQRGWRGAGGLRGGGEASPGDREEGGCERERRGLGPQADPEGGGRPGRAAEDAPEPHAKPHALHLPGLPPDPSARPSEIPGATPPSRPPRVAGAPHSLETWVRGLGPGRRCTQGLLSGWGACCLLLQRRRWRGDRQVAEAEGFPASPVLRGPARRGTNREPRARTGCRAGHPRLAPPPAGQGAQRAAGIRGGSGWGRQGRDGSRK